MKTNIAHCVCRAALLPAIILLYATTGLTAAASIRPLADDFVVVGESDDPKNTPLYSPSILRLDSGRLVAAYSRHPAKGPKRGVLLTSDDGGRSWKQRAELPALQGRVFKAGRSLYYLATGAGLPISRSDDNGETWPAPVNLSGKELVWQQTPANVWHAKGNVYIAYELAGRKINAWAPSEKALVLLRAAEKSDLTQTQNWTASSRLVFSDVLPGTRENDPRIDYVGIPFYPQSHPNRRPMAPRRSFSPIGWVEPGVVQILDPDHYWHDPSGRTFHILARAHTGGTGFACLTKVVENDDGSMTMSLQDAPSGRRMLFLPVPGGQMRFHILYDRETKLYWLLGTQATDSMRRADRLPPDRFDLAFNERQRLVLHFSKNLVDWCFAGLVATSGENGRTSRHYASMDIDGGDLVILARSGDGRAKSAHNGNLITFHRVKNFRELVY
ncbi:MAG: glycoside hydrolase [Opitutaceae bacterium]|jgi:hypothetical protein|nr:glycoside hydrolase [Opitutaceae bacterium]